MRCMKKENRKNAPDKKKLSGKQKFLISSIAVLTGFSVTVIGSSLITYNALFNRYERPDYAVLPGNYFYERISTQLYRKEFYISSNKEKLKAYFYPALNSKGIVVISPGYHSGADDYIPIIKYFTENHFSVFAYDLTGTYSSSGNDMVGWCQSLVDIDYVLKYIFSTEPYKSQPIFLFGYSWGGYAATSVLAIHKNIKACAGVAAMNNGSTIMLEKGSQYVGKLAEIPKPIINTYQKMLFGNYTEYNGVKGINSTDIPVLLAQGVDDKVITYGKQSVFAHRGEITNPNVRYYEALGLQGGHGSILFSVNAIAYQNEVKSRLEKLSLQKGGNLTYADRVDFFKTVDSELYSEVNKDLMDLIIATFNDALK